MNEIVKHNEMSLDDLQRTARLLAASGYFDAKGDNSVAIAQIATKILAGRELGYGPFASVQGIHVIQGRPALSANIMAAAVKNSPRYDYRVRKMDVNECTIEFFEKCDGKKESIGISTFTMDDAKKAQVKNLDKFARNMLFARAMSNGVRWFCPDVFSGNTVYVPEELGAETNDDGIVVVDSSTGEVIEKPAAIATINGNGHTNGNGHKPTPVAAKPAIVEAPAADNPFTPDAEQVQRIIESFKGLPSNAWAWAASNKYTENKHSGQTRWTEIVKHQFDGEYTPQKFPAIADAYIHHYLNKVAA